LEKKDIKPKREQQFNLSNQKNNGHRWINKREDLVNRINIKMEIWQKLYLDFLNILRDLIFAKLTEKRDNKIRRNSKAYWEQNISKKFKYNETIIIWEIKLKKNLLTPIINII
jgi:hypothetical protein